MLKNDEDTKLEKIGKYLELGGTMLAQHCECGAPLFRYHGNVVCPICDSNGSDNTAIDKPASTPEPATSHRPASTPEPITSHRPAPTPEPVPESGHAPKNISLETHEFINNTIINKVVQLCLDLHRETDLGRIKQQMEAIESGTKAMKNLKK